MAGRLLKVQSKTANKRKSKNTTNPRWRQKTFGSSSPVKIPIRDKESK